MQPGEMMRAARDVAKREWWLVAIVVVAALVGASLAGGGAKTSYQAQATFLADTTQVNRYKGVPMPDDVVRDVGTVAVQKSIAATVGVPAADVAGLHLSGFGNPQNRLLVSFSSPDRATALAIVWAADAAVLDYVARRTSVVRTDYQTSVDQADATIATLQKTLSNSTLDAWQRSDIEFDLWQVREGRIESQDVVNVISTVYQLQSQPTLAATSSTSALASRLAAALLAGLFVGLVLAGVREALVRRRETARP